MELHDQDLSRKCLRICWLKIQFDESLQQNDLIHLNELGLLSLQNIVLLLYKISLDISKPDKLLSGLRKIPEKSKNRHKLEE